MSNFILNCVNDVVFPLSTNTNEISQQIADLERLHNDMSKKLDKIIEKRDEILTKDSKADPILQEKILNYLAIAGNSNEFIIANDLKSNLEKTYETLSFLRESNKVELTTKLEWRLIKNDK